MPANSPPAAFPTSTDVKVDSASKLSKKPSAVVLLVDEAGLVSDQAAAGEAWSAAASAMLADRSLRGKIGETASAVVDGVRLIVVGTGDLAKAPQPEDALRVAGVAAARAARRLNLTRVELVAPAGRGRHAGVLAGGFLLGAFEYREYRGAAARREPPPFKNARLTIIASADAKEAVTHETLLTHAQNYARTVAMRPGNDINPPSLAREADRLAKATGLKLTVIDEKQARRLDMNGLLAVGGGSASPPRMIVLEHKTGSRKNARRRADDAARPLLVVGKAITFDTGGISIKPAADMGSMIYDKCGGMAVLGFMAAAATLDLDRPVVGILAAAENMPSSTAYRPGDILKMYNGVTVEVTNTDAEGRLVLADALAWGIETYKPAACVDLATLTGACVVALGTTRAGAWSNDDDLFATLDAASKRAGERIWRMPLGDDYREPLRAVAADVVNSPGRWGGCDTAAEFLHHFVPGNVEGTAEVPWCHLDIAGVADAEKETPLYTKGATGFAVRTLYEWARGFEASSLEE